MSDSLSSMNDPDLLKRFCRTQCEAAFQKLVERYGKLVMSVCLRVLKNRHDAEDAFQATFLVLAEKAGKIKTRDRRSLPSWLGGVAYRLSMNLARRHHRKDLALTAEPVAARNQFSDLEQRCDEQTMDEELHALPARYRDVLVRFYFLGQTSRQIAEALGITQGAADGRIKRGRQELRVRLARRGVALGALTVMALSAQTASASVGPTLVQSTVASAVAKGSVGLCSTPVAKLAGTELMKGISFVKSSLAVCVAVAVVGLCSFGLNASFAHSMAGGPVNTRLDAPEPPAGVQAALPLEPSATTQLMSEEQQDVPTKQEGASVASGEPVRFVAGSRQGGPGVDGTWKLHSQLIGGEPVEKKYLGGSVTIQDGSYLKAGKINVRFDSSTSPGTYSSSHPEMEGFHGIFKVNNDELVICRSYETKEKPRTFESTRTNEAHLLVYKRVDAVATQKPEFTLPGHLNVMSIRFGRDDKTLMSLATESGVTVRTWDVESRKLLREVELNSEKHGNRWLFSPPILSSTREAIAPRRVGAKAAVVIDGEVQVWDAVRGTRLRTLAADGVLRSEQFGLPAVTPDLSVVAADCGGGGRFRGAAIPVVVWNANTGDVLQTMRHKHAVQVRSLALSSDGSRLATGSYRREWFGKGVQPIPADDAATGDTCIWDVKSGRLLHQLPNSNPAAERPKSESVPGAHDHVINLAFSPDGKQLAIGDMLSVKLVDVESGKLQHRISAPFRFGRSRFVYSPDGGMLARVATDKVIRIWDTKTGKLLKTLQTPSHDASFSADSKWIAVARSHKSEGISVWKLRD